MIEMLREMGYVADKNNPNESPLAMAVRLHLRFVHQIDYPS